jgi:hypothetical protein
MSTSNSLRQQIADQITDRIREIEDPKPVLVTKEPFEVAEIAITQFPAVLVTLRQEDRETVTMGVPGTGRRMGTILFEIRAYVRGAELDAKRNTLLEALEEKLEEDRYLDLRSSGVIDSQIIKIEIVDRQPPLAEMLIELEVRYNYLRSTT